MFPIMVHCYYILKACLPPRITVPFYSMSTICRYLILSLISFVDFNSRFGKCLPVYLNITLRGRQLHPSTRYSQHHLLLIHADAFHLALTGYLESIWCALLMPFHWVRVALSNKLESGSGLAQSGPVQ